MPLLAVTGNLLPILIPLCLTYLLIRLLREKHAGYVHTLWLGFSISFVLTFPLAYIADSLGWIGAGGKLMEGGGEHVSKFIHFMLDIKTELILLGVIIGVIFSIQALTYLLAAPMGCATGFYMISQSFGVSTLLFLKSLISAAGFIASVVVNSWFYDWGPTLKEMQWVAFSMSAVMTVLSFAILYFYLLLPADMTKLRRYVIKRTPNLHRRLAKVHARATKYQPKQRNGSNEDDFWEIGKRAENVIIRHIEEKRALRRDIDELVVLIRASEKYDAKWEASAALGKEACPTPQQQAERRRMEKRIAELLESLPD